MKILIADDMPYMRELIRNALASGGYTDVIEVVNGAEAVAKYEEVRPDLVITDITMPVMDGITALKNILDMDADAKVVLCVAMGQEQYVMDGMHAGAKDFFVKPFRPERLLGVVNAVLGIQTTRT